MAHFSLLSSLLGVVLIRITYFGGTHSYVPWVPTALTAVLTYLLPEWHLPGQGQEPKWLCPGGYPEKQGLLLGYSPIA